jgi:hypothetical protein
MTPIIAMAHLIMSRNLIHHVTYISMAITGVGFKCFFNDACASGGCVPVIGQSVLIKMNACLTIQYGWYLCFQNRVPDN